jgi:multidrug efflux pump subunit AcrA (membrane-fusion protein)
VTGVAAAIGEHVTPDRAILTILDPGRVHIEAKVPEALIGRIASPERAAYELIHTPGEVHPMGTEGSGRWIHSGPEVDPVTRSVPLVYEVENRSGLLRIGLALDVHLETGRAEEVLAIPEAALVDEGSPVAYVQVSGEMFEKRYLDLGLRDGGFAEVRSGLAENERVVTRRAHALRLASMSGAIAGHGHAH